MSAISFTWTMSPNCEASSSTCLWRLRFIVPPRKNTTLLGAKLVIKSRDCRGFPHFYTDLVVTYLVATRKLSQATLTNQKERKAYWWNPNIAENKAKPTQLRPTLIQTRVSCLPPNLCAPPHDQPSCSLRCKVLIWD